MEWLNSHIEHYLIKGCPQGSCLGPFLWMPFLETLLLMYLVANCLLVAYADNLHLVIRGSSLSTLENEGNAALKIIEEGAKFETSAIFQNLLQEY